MSHEQRKSERSTDYLPLEVHVTAGLDDRILAGPYSGRIIDISAHGACLLMTQVLVNGVHLFYTTRDRDDAALRLTITLGPEIVTTLTARPVWLDRFRLGEISAFKMGVEFAEALTTARMREVRAALGSDREVRASWWRRHFEG